MLVHLQCSTQASLKKSPQVSGLTSPLASNRQPGELRSAHGHIASPLHLSKQHSHAVVQSPSCVWLFAAPWTVNCQAPLSLECSRQEYWSGLPFLSPGDLPGPGIEPVSPALAGGFFIRQFFIATREASWRQLQNECKCIGLQPEPLSTDGSWLFLLPGCRAAQSRVTLIPDPTPQKAPHFPGEAQLGVAGI